MLATVAVGFETTATVSPQPVETALPPILQATQAGLPVMGAYGQTRIRHLIIGSTTTAWLRTSSVPVLILR